MNNGKLNLTPEEKKQRWAIMRKVWAEKNPEKIKSIERRSSKKKYQKNPEYNKKWRQLHPERAKINSRTATNNYLQKNPQYIEDWKKANPEKIKFYMKKYYTSVEGKEATRKYRLKTGYNFTIEEYNTLFELQKGCCGICEVHQKHFKARLCVDHDHSTGKVRGLLCKNCNLVLGHAKDTVDILQKGIDYLKKEFLMNKRKN